jgi:hypothetical protein
MRVIPMLLVAAWLALACHSGPSGHPNDQTEPALPTNLIVVNQGFLDMDIFAVPQGGGRQRLGTATGNSTQTFRIPDYMVRTSITLRFLCVPIGGDRSPVSEAINVNPGDDVQLTIPPA